MNHHIAQGRTVAQARFFLERHGQLAEPIEFLASANGATLTAEMVRVLIAEHDAYRDEVRTYDDGATKPDTSLTENIDALCDSAYNAWQRARAESSLETVPYLVLAFEHLTKAKRADERTRQAGR